MAPTAAATVANFKEALDAAKIDRVLNMQKCWQAAVRRTSRVERIGWLVTIHWVGLIGWGS